MPDFKALLPEPTEGSKHYRNAGRKKTIDEEVLNKLRFAYLYGCSDDEACAYADISRQTLWRHRKTNPDFEEWRDMLRQNPYMLARKTIVDHLDKDPDFALKYMERKRKNEFSPRTEMTGKGGAPLHPEQINDDEVADLDAIFGMHTEKKAEDAKQ